MSQGNGNGETPPPFSIIAEHAVPDYYSDSVSFEISVYGVTLEFGQTRKPPPNFKGPVPVSPKVRIHMSPQHAKVMAKLFARNMADYEAKVGKITLPAALLDELKLKDEW